MILFIELPGTYWLQFYLHPSIVFLKVRLWPIFLRTSWNSCLKGLLAPTFNLLIESSDSGRKSHKLSISWVLKNRILVIKTT